MTQKKLACAGEQLKITAYYLTSIMSLQEEIDKKASQIYRDAYQMSIGELINLYKDNELEIHPEFQRVFRWSSFQKTRLIESIMLNIPIPPIFVSQQDTGIWDVVDGVQRLSTIFQFVGIYKNSDNKLEAPLKLEGTEYLPSFEGMEWNGDDPQHSFTTEQKINFKRSRIDVIIVKKESDISSKFELFQRLNTGGSSLSAQEIRNCLLIMDDKQLFETLSSLKNNTDFDECTPVSDRLIDEQYKTELVIRLLIAYATNEETLSKYRDLTDLLDKESLKLSKYLESHTNMFNDFEATFRFLRQAEGENTFKRHDANGGAKGAFLSGAYQGIASGVMVNISAITRMQEHDRIEWLRSKIQKFYISEEFQNMMGQGVKPLARFQGLSRFGINHFSSIDNEQ